MANEEALNNLDFQLTMQPGDKHFVFQGQCLILGDSGVGKTSLVKSLKGQSFDPNQPKTQGIDESLVDQNWKNLAVKDLIFGNLWWLYQQLSEQRTLYGPSEHSNIIVRSLDNRKNSHLTTYSVYLCLIYFLLTGAWVSPLLVLFLVLYTVFFFLFYFNYNFRLLVTTFTFAMKPRGLLIGAFLAFMSLCYYLGKFDMSSNENGFADIDTKVKRLQFWLESICSHVPPNTPKVLVGTHRENIDNECVNKLDNHLRRNLWNTFCDELVANDDENLIFFPVENSKGNNDTGIQVLKNKVISIVQECRETIRQEIPFSWIRIQDAIISIQRNKDAKFCVSVKELPMAIDNLVPRTCKWSKETLKYFHEKGLVIYLDRNQDLDLSNWILLKPQTLIDIFIQLVTPPPKNTQQRGLRHAWHLLQEKGMLNNSLLRNIISKVQENEEAIMAFLEEYAMICPLINKKVRMCNPHEESEEQPTHFVPSLLPMSADGDVPVWHDDDTDKKFYIFFRRFLPEPLFHRLLSRAHKSSKVEFLHGQTVLYRDAGKFWMRSSLPYMLKLMREEKMIKVTFRCRTDCEMRPADVLSVVFSMVDGICKSYFPFVKFHCGPACPSSTCPGHQDDYLVSPPAGMDQGTRPHVYNVMPGQQGDRVVAFLYCEDHSFKDALGEWIL